MIQEELNKLSPDHKKKIRANNTYYILKNTDIPTVIVECGFLSNAEDEKLLTSKSYREQLAYEIFTGTLAFLG